MVGKQRKLYRSGQKPAAGGPKITSNTGQSRISKTQTGKTHSVKNRVVNHNRSR